MKKNYQDAIPKNTSYCYIFLGENGSGEYNIKPFKYFKDCSIGEECPELDDIQL